MAKFIRAEDGRYINTYHIHEFVPTAKGDYIVNYPKTDERSVLVDATTVHALVAGRSRDAQARRARRTRAAGGED